MRGLIAALISVSTPAFAMRAALPALHADPQSVTISGLSSGAFLAVQMQVAYSASISGAASFAGGIYWCAEGQQEKTEKCLDLPEDLQVSRSLVKARAEAKAKNIDALENLAKAKIYLYAGTVDSIVNPLGSQKLLEFFKDLGTTQILFRHEIKSGHGIPTRDFGSPCQESVSPFLVKCHFDGAGEMLQQLYGPLAAPTAAQDSRLFKFDQSEFAERNARMTSEGYVYIPEACQSQNCRLHVALHGCEQSSDFVGTTFVKKAGFNNWAESNHMIILYPQVSKSDGNSLGCWDWWGYTGPDYAIKSGRQMRAIKGMIDRLIGL